MDYFIVEYRESLIFSLHWLSIYFLSVMYSKKLEGHLKVYIGYFYVSYQNLRTLKAVVISGNEQTIFELIQRRLLLVYQYLLWVVIVLTYYFCVCAVGFQNRRSFVIEEYLFVLLKKNLSFLAVFRFRDVLMRIRTTGFFAFYLL